MVEKHWQWLLNVDRINELSQAIRLLEPDQQVLPLARFANLDQYHIGGLQAADQMLALSDLHAGQHLLDLGSGLGGPARYAWSETGCVVTGIDIDPHAIEIANQISARTGAELSVRFLERKMEDVGLFEEKFDAVWCFHASIFVRDKNQLFESVRQVLKPGGRFVLIEPFLTDSSQMHDLPTHWANDLASNHIAALSPVCETLTRQGFEITETIDLSPMCLEWFKAQASMQSPALSLKQFVGEDFHLKSRNTKTSLVSGMIQVHAVQAFKPK